MIDDLRVRIIVKPNGGLSSARNAALEVAEGEFVAFVDSDDEVLPGAFDRCVSRLVSDGLDVALYGVKVIWVEEQLQKVDRADECVYGALRPEIVLDLSRRCLLNYACNKVYRNAFLRAHGLAFDVRGMPCEDIIFNLQCALAGARWCSVDCVGYVYYRTGMTLLSKYKPSNYDGLRAASVIWCRYKDSFPLAREVLGNRGELTREAVAREERRNRLRPGSPYWLAPAYNFLRGILYTRAVRRWHIRRLYPQAVAWEGTV